MYVNDLPIEGPDMDEAMLNGSVIAGDIIVIRQFDDDTFWWRGTVDVITDDSPSNGAHQLDVTHISSNGSLPGGNDNLMVEFYPQNASAGELPRIDNLLWTATTDSVRHYQMGDTSGSGFSMQLGGRLDGSDGDHWVMTPEAGADVFRNTEEFGYNFDNSYWFVEQNFRFVNGNTVADYMQIEHDGTDVNFSFGGTAVVEFGAVASFYSFLSNVDVTADLFITGGNQFQIFDSSGSDSIIWLHDGDDLVQTFANTSQWDMIGLTGGIQLRDGAYFRAFGNSDILFTTLYHDDTDGHIGAAGGSGALLVDSAMAWESSTEVISGNAATLTMGEGNAFEVDLDAATANVTITLSGGPTTSNYYAASVKVIQDSTNRTITWAGGTFRWLDGAAHVQATGNDAVSIYSFETWDGGTIWYGSGADYS